MPNPSEFSRFRRLNFFRSPENKYFVESHPGIDVLAGVKIDLTEDQFSDLRAREDASLIIVRRVIEAGRNVIIIAVHQSAMGNYTIIDRRGHYKDWLYGLKEHVLPEVENL